MYIPYLYQGGGNKDGTYLQSFTQSFYSYFFSNKGEIKDSLSQQIICYYYKLHLVQSVSYTKHKVKFPCAGAVYSHCMSFFIGELCDFSTEL